MFRKLFKNRWATHFEILPKQPLSTRKQAAGRNLQQQTFPGNKLRLTLVCPAPITICVGKIIAHLGDQTGKLLPIEDSSISRPYNLMQSIPSSTSQPMTCMHAINLLSVLRLKAHTPKNFILTTDASGAAIGSVLSQGEIGQDLPISYASRTLSKSEKNYYTTDKELLAIVWSIKDFRPYLYGRTFKVVTDHKPLMYLFICKDVSSLLMRWRLLLEEFDFKIVHKNGKLNTNADYLSRVYKMTLRSADKKGPRNSDKRIPCCGRCHKDPTIINMT